MKNPALAVALRGFDRSLVTLTVDTLGEQDAQVYMEIFVVLEIPLITVLLRTHGGGWLAGFRKNLPHAETDKAELTTWARFCTLAMDGSWFQEAWISPGVPQLQAGTPSSNR